MSLNQIFNSDPTIKKWQTLRCYNIKADSSSYIPAISGTDIRYQNAYFDNISGGSMVDFNNISGVNLNYQYGMIDNITATNVHNINLLTQNIFCNNLTASNILSSNINCPTITATNILSTNLKITNLTAANVGISSLTASKFVSTDSNKNLISTDLTLTPTFNFLTITGLANQFLFTGNTPFQSNLTVYTSNVANRNYSIPDSGTTSNANIPSAIPSLPQANLNSEFQFLDDLLD